MATVIYKPFRKRQNTSGSQLIWNIDNISSCGPLRAIAMPGGSLVDQSETGELEFARYRTGAVVSGTLTGIELIVTAHKYSRVLDKTVQLKLGGVLIGTNKAKKDADGYYVYGSASDMWNTALTLSDMTSLSVILQYKSNDIIPHSDTVFVETAHLRLTYTP